MVAAMERRFGKSLSACLAGLQASMLGVWWMLAWMGASAVWERRSFWTPENLMASVFYGNAAILPGFASSTVSGLALYVLLYSLLGAGFAMAVGAGEYRVRAVLVLRRVPPGGEGRMAADRSAGRRADHGSWPRDLRSAAGTVPGVPSAIRTHCLCGINHLGILLHPTVVHCGEEGSASRMQQPNRPVSEIPAAFKAETVRERWVLAALAVVVLAITARGEIIDRIAVSVGNRVIAESDLNREIRVAAFLDGVKPDFSPAGKRATAQRMVEQVLIRRELETSRYPVPSAAEVAPVLAAFQKEHFPREGEYQRALADDGIADQDVKDLLLWQRTLLLFIEVRFQSAVQVTGQDIQDYFDKVVEPAAEAAHPGQPIALEDYRDRIEQTLTGQRADREMDTWLKEVRSHTEVVFHEEVFQ
jgi:hypothetical protein